MGKAIYEPKGKAAEYNEWAVNFYNGCEGDCSYCYLKEFPMSQFWSTTPTLKKTLVDEKTAIQIFAKEVKKYKKELLEHGLFFNFSSDPMLKSTYRLNMQAMNICFAHGIQQIILTKQAGFTKDLFMNGSPPGPIRDKLFWGATLTGHDELEPGCSSNEDRIEMLKIVHDLGIKTWASIEPIIDFKSSHKMISASLRYCDHYKIGLMSGKHYDIGINVFVKNITNIVAIENKRRKKYKMAPVTIYFKESIVKTATIDRSTLPYFCVESTFKPWKDELSFHA